MEIDDSQASACSAPTLGTTDVRSSVGTEVGNVDLVVSWTLPSLSVARAGLSTECVHTLFADDRHHE